MRGPRRSVRIIECSDNRSSDNRGFTVHCTSIDKSLRFLVKKHGIQFVDLLSLVHGNGSKSVSQRFSNPSD